MHRGTSEGKVTSLAVVNSQLHGIAARFLSRGWLGQRSTVSTARGLAAPVELHSLEHVSPVIDGLVELPDCASFTDYAAPIQGGKTWSRPSEGHLVGQVQLRASEISTLEALRVQIPDGIWSRGHVRGMCF